MPEGYPCGDERPGGKLVVDMGGGSTEWILLRRGSAPLMASIPIGVIKLSGKYLKSDPAVQKEVDELENEIMSVLENLHMRIGRYFDNNILLIGTAGTFTTLASLDLELEQYAREKIHMHRIPLERLLTLFRRLIALPLEERKKTKGLEPERADLIIPGIIFTISTMKYFGFREITISDYGLLEGALLDIEETGEKSISKT
jgi:exopolyphosphatase / guanosine-5'-triphosphate,3'-diphosphate pyrophosphatase